MKKFFSITKALFTVMMMMAFLGMAACAKKSNGGASRVQNRGTGLPLNTNGFLGGNNINYNNGYNNGQIGGIPNQTSCAGAQSAGRLVEDGSLYGGSFRANYAEFLGVELGELSGSPNSNSTGVDFKLRLKVNGQNVIAEQSSMEMTVWDSYTTEYPDLVVAYQAARSGSVDSSGAATLVFEDQYGQVYVKARIQGNLVQGQVYFRNNDMNTEKSLGSFTLSSCAVLY